MNISSNLNNQLLSEVIKEFKKSNVVIKHIFENTFQNEQHTSCYFEYENSIYFISALNGIVDVMNKLDDIEIKNEIKLDPLDKITIFSDGGCCPNPGEGGSGLSVYNENVFIAAYYGLYIKNSTNNISELNATFEALKLAELYILTGTNKVVIKTDSKYSMNCLTLWIDSWIKNKWMTANKLPVKNKEIIQPMNDLYQKIKDKVDIQHVKAHSGIEGNEIADRMATMAIQRKELKMVICNDDIKEILKG